MQQFFDSMHEKFLLRATGECHHCEGKGGIQGKIPLGETFFICERCNGTGKENRSLTPWKDYSQQFLIDRLNDEIEEFRTEVSINRQFPNEDAAADELLDIANFAAFLWLKWKEGQ